MSGTAQQQGLDLFDDPSWVENDGDNTRATGLPAWTGSVLVLIWLCLLLLLSIALFVFLVFAGIYLGEHLLQAGVGQQGNLGR
jgi:hypothetical protein